MIDVYLQCCSCPFRFSSRALDSSNRMVRDEDNPSVIPVPRSSQQIRCMHPPMLESRGRIRVLRFTVGKGRCRDAFELGFTGVASTMTLLVLNRDSWRSNRSMEPTKEGTL